MRKKGRMFKNFLNFNAWCPLIGLTYLKKPGDIGMCDLNSQRITLRKTDRFSLTLRPRVQNFYLGQRMIPIRLFPGNVLKFWKFARSIMKSLSTQFWKKITLCILQGNSRKILNFQKSFQRNIFSRVHFM